MKPEPSPHDPCARCGHTRRYHDVNCFQWMEPATGSPYAFRLCGCPRFTRGGASRRATRGRKGGP